MDLAIEHVYQDSLYIDALRRLRGHSFRSALPTHMQAMGEELTLEEKKLMGRWFTEQAYALYCKDKTQNRLNIAHIVAKHLQST